MTVSATAMISVAGRSAALAWRKIASGLDAWYTQTVPSEPSGSATT